MLALLEDFHGEVVVMSTPPLPRDVVNNLDHILARDTIYLTRAELDRFDKLLTRQSRFVQVFSDYLLMLTRHFQAGATSCVAHSLIPNHSGYKILVRCHDGSLQTFVDSGKR